VRAVLDPNVMISGLLSAEGAPADILRAVGRGELDVVVSPKLIDELARALTYPKLSRHISGEDAAAFVAWLGRTATSAADPDDPPSVHSADAGDDYLIALASTQRVALVSGDKHLLSLERDIPVFSPRALLELVHQGRGRELPD
jgi:putative PIN family toxin of toxin-antitoxin system